jgi:hypothetical protein
MPSLTPISTPNNNDLQEQTPSPQSVHEFNNRQSSTALEFCKPDRSDVVSDLISDQLVTDYVCDVDCALPQSSLEEEENASSEHEALDHSESPASSNSTIEASASSHAIIPTPQVNSLDPWSTSPTACQPNIIYGPERLITFHTESLGLKLSRHTDGRVRILSISPYRALDDTPIRQGHIQEGDLVLRVADVDLSRPIDGNVWKLTVGLIKMAPRPLSMVVCTEYQEVEDVNDAECAISNDAVESVVRSVSSRCCVTGQTIVPLTPELRRGWSSGETRQIVFYEHSLGVKLQHNKRGYVVVHSISESGVNDKTTDPPSRKGELKPGDVVLEVGGVWDLYHPISINAWGILVKFIRECRRPMRMIVADEEYLNVVSSPGSCSEESSSSLEMSPGCSSVDGRMNRIIEEREDELKLEVDSKLTLSTDDESSAACSRY